MDSTAGIAFAPMNEVRCELGEGPVWDGRRNALWNCDIANRALHRFELASRVARHWTFPSEVCSIGLAASGRLVVALRHEVGIFDPDSERFDRIAEIEGERGSDTRLNDGKVGPDGAFWVGSMDNRGRAKREPIGTLYRVSADGGVEAKVPEVAISNGLAWSPDGRTMYHADTAGGWLDRWSFDPASGAIGERTRIAMLDEATGRPDGGATDVDGGYWSAAISAARLNRFDRDGRIIATYPVPVGAPTMPCFGGADMRTLFVTSLRTGRSPELLTKYPLTGIVVMGRSPIAGTPVSEFRDR